MTALLKPSRLARDVAKHQTFFKSDMLTRLDIKSEGTATKAAQWRLVCREVDRRDGMKCRACKRPVVKTLARQKDRLERHHVTPRSLGGEDLISNICVLCLKCHDLRHTKRRLHILGDANEKLRFELNGRKWRG